MTLKDKIIISSLRLFSTSGFMNTSISDVMTAAGVSKGGLYNHFKSKDELFYAALEEAKSIWREKNLYGLDQIDDPLKKLTQLFKNYHQRYLTDQDLPGGCIFVNLVVELNDQRIDLADDVNEGFVRLKRLMGRFIESAKERGIISASTHTENVVDMLTATLLGACVMYTSDKSAYRLGCTIRSLAAYTEGLRVNT